MTVRLIFGLGWSLVAGLTGGWLLLAPWALGERGGSDWTTVTRSEFGAGLGLIVLALAGIAVVAAQTVASLREAGVLAPSRSSARAGAAGGPSSDMEEALIALARALADDLDAQREPAPGARAGGEQPGVSGRREQP